MSNNNNLFVFESDTTPQLTVDLAKIALMNKRADGYWIRMLGGDSLAVKADAGAAVHAAWIAYQGKFNPATDR